MSESNSGKNKTSNVAIILVLFYIILLVVYTIYSIYFYKKNNISAFKYYSYKLFGNENLESTDPDLIETIKFIDNDKKIDRVSLSDRYFINNITFNEIKDKKGDVIYTSEDGKYESNFIELRYYEIDGLKNKDIQNKINADIKKHVYDDLDEIYEYIDKYGQENIYDIEITAYINGSYSNILSIYITKFINFNNYVEYEENSDRFINENTYLNYRLDTGEYLKLSDCFTKDASIKNILSQTYYKQRAWYYSYNIENPEELTEDDYKAVDDDGNEIYGMNMDRRDYGDIEDDVLKLLYDYDKNKDNIKLSLSENYLGVLFEDYYIHIPMYEYYEYIDIAKKYVSDESLFEEGNLDKTNYMYVIPISSHFDYFDYLTTNKFLAVNSQEMLIRDFYKINYVENDMFDYGGIDEEEADRLIDKIKSYLKENESIDGNKGYMYYISLFKDYDYELENKYYYYVERIELDSNNFEENVQNVNYEIFNNISEGYLGMYNLEEKEQKKYNLIEYRIKESDDGKLFVEEI